MSLLELLLALALASILVLGLVQMATAAGAAERLQRNQSQLLDRARFAFRTLARAVRQAGFHPRPWENLSDREVLGDGNLDAASPGGDRLSVRGWSDRNCFGNRNPELDAAGRPRFYLRESSFDINASGHLAHTCRYGPAADALVTQIRRQGLLPGVESFQLLFGQDTDADGQPDDWAQAGVWADPSRVLGVRVGLLLAGDDVVTEPRADEFDVLGDTVRPPADGRLRRLLDVTLTMRGRVP